MRTKVADWIETMADFDNEEISLENIEALIADLGDDPVFDLSTLESQGVRGEASSSKKRLDSSLESTVSALELHRQRFERLGPLAGPIARITYSADEFLYFLGDLERRAKLLLISSWQLLKRAPQVFQRPSAEMMGKFSQLAAGAFQGIGKGYDGAVHFLVHFDLVKFSKVVLGLSIPTGIGLVIFYFFHSWVWSSPIVTNFSILTNQPVLGLSQERVIWDELLSPAPFAPHEFQFPKMVLNLKDGRAGFELTVHLSNAESVEELKAATSYFADSLQTDFLSVSSGELSVSDDLSPIRQRIQELINADLKKGEVIRVLYSLFLLRS